MDRKVLFSGIQIAYTIEGEGPAVVFLHGFAENRTIWKSYMNDLSSEYAVVAIDLPGHGESEYYQDLSIEFMADVVDAVLNDAAIPSAAIVGHSMGGQVALSFAENYPSKKKGICLFHSSARADSPEQKFVRRKNINEIFENVDGFLDNFFVSLFSQGNQKWFKDEIATLKEQALTISSQSLVAAQKAMMNRMGSLELLTQTNVPILFIIGKRDSLGDIGKAIAQSMLPKKSFMAMIENCGHMGFIESPHECFAAIKGFLVACY